MTSESAPTKRLQWIEHAGKTILFIDLNGIPAVEALRVLDSVSTELDGRPPNSVLVLTDVTGTGYDPSIGTRWKAAHVAFAPIVRGSAVFGLSGIVGVATRSFVEVLRFMGLSRQEKLRLFATREEALAWLTTL